MALFLPLIAALSYAFGALVIKRALERGAGIASMTLFGNVALAVAFLPFAWLGPASFWPDPLWPALVYGLLVAVGNLAVFAALIAGDVSVATPILGSKVVVVALLAALVLGQKLGPATWAAVALCLLALLLLRPRIPGRRRALGLSLLASLVAATFFAGADIIVQRFAPHLGFTGLMPAALLVCGLVSLPLLPFCIRERHALRRAARPALLGALLNAGQGVLLSAAIALYHDATATNIIYASRGVFSVLLVIAVGHWFGNRERHLGRRELGLRVVGAALILVAVMLAQA
jgi:uncharacterized membrane protein